MTQFQQIPQGQNDAQLYQMWQQSEFQKWKQSRFPYRNQLDEPESNTGKWIIGIVLMVIVGVVSFLLFKNRDKFIKPVLKKQIAENEESFETLLNQRKPLNGKKPYGKAFSKIDQHREFRDKSMADMQPGIQTFEEFEAWLTSELGFEKIGSGFYTSEVKECEVKVLKNGIEIYPNGSTDFVFRAFTEIENLSFREEFLDIIKP